MRAMNRIGGQTSELLANSLLASETPNPVIDKKRINWLSIFKDGKVALCACHCIGCHLKQLKVDGSATVPVLSRQDISSLSSTRQPTTRPWHGGGEKSLADYCSVNSVHMFSI